MELLAKCGNPHAYFDSPVLPKRATNFFFGNYRSLAEKIIAECYAKHPDLPIDCPPIEAADIAASVQRSMVQYLGSRIQALVKFLESTQLLSRDTEHILEQDPGKLSYSYTDYLDPKPVKIHLVISGGVACNDYITQKLTEYCQKMETIYEETKVQVVAPNPKNLCTDNGVMISWNGVIKLINFGEKFLLKNAEQITSLTPVYDAPLGKDMREFIDMQSFPVKHVEISA